jgi:hypothetical protein
MWFAKPNESGRSIIDPDPYSFIIDLKNLSSIFILKSNKITYFVCEKVFLSRATKWPGSIRIRPDLSLTGAPDPGPRFTDPRIRIRKSYFHGSGTLFSSVFSLYN